MATTQKNLNLFEAIELRNEYDRHIIVLEKLLKNFNNKYSNPFSHDENKNIKAVSGC